jgi:hypothetical protein
MIAARPITRWAPTVRSQAKCVPIRKKPSIQLQRLTRTFSTTSKCLASPADQSLIDAKMEELQELYATARDEFEIAAEETEKQTVYAEEDRKAAREEFNKLNKFVQDIIEGNDQVLAGEVRKRIGPRIKELENALLGVEEMAKGQD